MGSQQKKLLNSIKSSTKYETKELDYDQSTWTQYKQKIFLEEQNGIKIIMFYYY